MNPSASDNQKQAKPASQTKESVQPDRQAHAPLKSKKSKLHRSIREPVKRFVSEQKGASQQALGHQKKKAASSFNWAHGLIWAGVALVIWKFLSFFVKLLIWALILYLIYAYIWPLVQKSFLH